MWRRMSDVGFGDRARLPLPGSGVRIRVAISVSGRRTGLRSCDGGRAGGGKLQCQGGRNRTSILWQRPEAAGGPSEKCLPVVGH